MDEYEKRSYLKTREHVVTRIRKEAPRNRLNRLYDEAYLEGVRNCTLALVLEMKGEKDSKGFNDLKLIPLMEIVKHMEMDLLDIDYWEET